MYAYYNLLSLVLSADRINLLVRLLELESIVCGQHVRDMFGDVRSGDHAASVGNGIDKCLPGLAVLDRGAGRAQAGGKISGRSDVGLTHRAYSPGCSLGASARGTGQPKRWYNSPSSSSSRAGVRPNSCRL